MQLCGLGLGFEKHRLVLPECVCLSLHLADGLDWLDVTAPKMVKVDLQACYSLNHVRLSPDEGPKVEVNLVNANIDHASLEHLFTHPRVGEANIDQDVSEDEYEELDDDELFDPADLLMDDEDPRMLDMMDPEEVRDMMIANMTEPEDLMHGD